MNEWLGFYGYSVSCLKRRLIDTSCVPKDLTTSAWQEAALGSWNCLTQWVLSLSWHCLCRQFLGSLHGLVMFCTGSLKSNKTKLLYFNPWKPWVKNIYFSLKDSSFGYLVVIKSWWAPTFTVVELADGYCFYIYMHDYLSWYLDKSHLLRGGYTSTLGYHTWDTTPQVLIVFLDFYYVWAQSSRICFGYTFLPIPWSLNTSSRPTKCYHTPTHIIHPHSINFISQRNVLCHYIIWFLQVFMKLLKYSSLKSCPVCGGWLRLTMKLS